MPSSDQTNLPNGRKFRGYAGGAPITVALYSDDQGEPEGVHIGWSDGGIYLSPFQARQLARFITDVAKECRS